MSYALFARYAEPHRQALRRNRRLLAISKGASLSIRSRDDGLLPRWEWGRRGPSRAQCRLWTYGVRPGHPPRWPNRLPGEAPARCRTVVGPGGERRRCTMSTARRAGLLRLMASMPLRPLTAASRTDSRPSGPLPNATVGRAAARPQPGAASVNCLLKLLS